MRALMSQADAEAIAIEALAWLAQDKDLLPRFLSLTGIEATSIRQAALEPGFLAGVLQFFWHMSPHCCATVRRLVVIQQQSRKPRHICLAGCISIFNENLNLQIKARQSRAFW